MFFFKWYSMYLNVPYMEEIHQLGKLAFEQHLKMAKPCKINYPVLPVQYSAFSAF